MVLPRKNKGLKQDYLRCRFQGFCLTVFKESAETEFLKLCCKRPSNSDQVFTKVPGSDHTEVYHFKYMGRQYYYKAFLHRNRIEPIKIFLNKSRAKRALRGFFLLHANGFHTPRIVVVGEKKQYNFMVSEAVTNPDNLEIYFQQKSAPPLSKEKLRQKRKVITELGDTIGRLHSLGICHGDLRWGNILIDHSDSCRIHFTFLDNERTKCYGFLPVRYRLKNLVQLNMAHKDIIVSNSDRLRFFQSYLIHNPKLIPQKKKWIQQILEKTTCRFARKKTRLQMPNTEGHPQSSRGHDGQSEP